MLLYIRVYTRTVVSNVETFDEMAKIPAKTDRRWRRLRLLASTPPRDTSRSHEYRNRISLLACFDILLRKPLIVVNGLHRRRFTRLLQRLSRRGQDSTEELHNWLRESLKRRHKIDPRSL